MENPWLTLRFWADLSTVWIMGGVFLMGLLPLVGLYFAVRGMFIVNGKLPRYFKLGQYYSGIVRDQTRKVSLKVADPLVRAHGESARVDAVLRNLQPGKQSSEKNQKE